MPESTHDILMTLTVALASGTALIVLARILNQSSIVLLLAGGVLLGPEGIGWVRPDSLGDNLGVIVSLAVAVILFEGGLTLDLKGYRAAPALIRRLLTVGVLTTWGGAWIAMLAIFPFSPAFAALASSMLIVTGPTVIAPLLRRIKASPSVHHVLHWEGVLIDPIGVFLVLLTFEWIDGRGNDRVLGGFAARIVLGLLVGLVSGFGFDRVLRRKWIPEDLVDSFSLAFALVVYGGCEALGHHFGFNESGLMAVVVAGFTLVVLDPPQLHRIREFAATLTDLMIGLLFIVLSARLELADFRDFGPRGFLLVGLVVFVLRPLNVFMSSVGLSIPWRERVFLSWIAPRGIVAASMASLLAIKLAEAGSPEEGVFLQTLVFSVIVATIVLQGTTADALARVLGLKAPPPTGWMIVGAHELGRRVARFIADRSGAKVLLVDLNPRLVAEARAKGLPALAADARDAALYDHEDFSGIGRLLSLADNEHLNALVCERWSPVLGKDCVFGWAANPVEPGNGATGAHAIWTDVPRPSVVSADLLANRAALVEARKDQPPSGVFLLHAAPGRVRPTAPPPELPPSDSSASSSRAIEAWRLELVRREPRLVKALRAGDVLNLGVASPAELFERIVPLALRSDGVAVARGVAELLSRERDFPTFLANGVALPHLRVEGLAEQVCVIARLDPAIPYDEAGRLVHLVFLLVGPDDDPSAHLAAMSEISIVASEKSVRSAIQVAESREAVIESIRTFLLLGPERPAPGIPKATPRSSD